MAMTLRLTDEEQAGLGAHRERVAAAAQRVLEVHADALRRLGE